MKKIHLSQLSQFLLIAIGAIFVYSIGAVPLYRQWKDLNRRIEVVNLQYLRNAKTVSNIDEYLKRYQTYEPILKLSRRDEEEVAYFLKQIEAFGNNIQIKINDIKPLEPEKGAVAQIFFIELEIETNIQGLMTFLYNVASSGEMIRLERMSLGSKARQQEVLTSKLVFSKTFIVAN